MKRRRSKDRLARLCALAFFLEAFSLQPSTLRRREDGIESGDSHLLYSILWRYPKAIRGAACCAQLAHQHVQKARFISQTSFP